jgi:hypothetical protein
MSRVRHAAAAAFMGFALAGCSAMPSWMPDWMSSKPPSAQLQDLRVETNPPGADVRTAQGQTCVTPCSISVPAENQVVTIAKVGFVPQTIQISTGPPPDHSFWENPPPTLVPNPVQVVMQMVPPPPKPIHKPKVRNSVSRARTAARMPPQQGANPFPDPSPARPAAEPFPPPAAGSPFPPPQQQ